MFKSLVTLQHAPDYYSSALKEQLSTHYNACYSNWREIDSKTFFSKYFAWVKTCAQFKQVLLNGHYVDVEAFFFSDGTGVAFDQDGRFYAFGCEHKFVFDRNLGRCYNRYVCTLCGAFSCVDSSD